ncbi:MAG: tetratricopeptide repeat protein [Coriobacteriales bacterium]|nr:tetratricopeptide repeat protein [Coriobacteriales bacterium]
MRKICSAMIGVLLAACLMGVGAVPAFANGLISGLFGGTTDQTSDVVDAEEYYGLWIGYYILDDGDVSYDCADYDYSNGTPAYIAFFDDGMTVVSGDEPIVAYWKATADGLMVAPEGEDYTIIAAIADDGYLEVWPATSKSTDGYLAVFRWMSDVSDEAADDVELVETMATICAIDYKWQETIAQEVGATESKNQTLEFDQNICSLHFDWTCELTDYVYEIYPPVPELCELGYGYLIDTIDYCQSHSANPNVYNEWIGVVYFDWAKCLLDYMPYDTVSYDGLTKAENNAVTEDGRQAAILSYKYFEKALDYDPNYATVSDYASALYMAGETSEAISVLEENYGSFTTLNGIDTGDAYSICSGLVNLGLMKFETGDTKGAIEVFNQLAALDKNDAYGYRTKAETFLNSIKAN